MSVVSQFKLTCDAGRDRSAFAEVSRGFFTCLSLGTSKMMFKSAFWKERSLLMFRVGGPVEVISVLTGAFSLPHFMRRYSPAAWLLSHIHCASLPGQASAVS